jgi:hypothetical protein
MNWISRIMWLSLLLPLTTAGCAAKLRPRKDQGRGDAAVADGGPIDRDASLDGGIPVYSGKFKNSGKRDGSLSTATDATDDKSWQQFDLDTGREATSERDWDIAFQRFKIKTNGGESGSGGVYVVQLEGQPFDELDQAPSMGFAADAPDSVGDAGDTDLDPDNVFNSGSADWYDYNVNNHTLKPKDITYVIASTEKRFFKFRIEAYYDSAGTPAKWKFHWKELSAPESGFPPPGGGASGGN